MGKSNEEDGEMLCGIEDACEMNFVYRNPKSPWKSAEFLWRHSIPMLR